MIKRYSELITLPTFEQRFNYLQLDSLVGVNTFGYDRYLNQNFYKSDLWKRIRREIILRDNGCDLACEDHPIFGRVIIHHLNPITIDDILNESPNLIDPENLITTMHLTHNAMHYGSDDILKANAIVERQPNDTIPWR